jgi:GR25 family glycosyltransferase involved in LPS biosynthesis
MKTRKSRPMAVYWINLDRSTERRENMLKVLKDPVFDGMAKHRVKAYDGGDPTDEKKMRTIIEIPDKANMKEYACLLSHIKALTQFSKSDSTIAIILEDDVSLDLKPYWQTSIQHCIRNAPSDWELLQISYLPKCPNKLYTPTRKLSGTLSYAVNKKGAIRFLKQFHLDNLPNVADYLLYNQMKSYTYQYSFFVATSKDSEIHPEHIKKYHLPGKQKIEDFLRTRTFPVKPDTLYVSTFENVDVSRLSKIPVLILYVKSIHRKQLPFLPNVIVRDYDEVKQSSTYDFLSHTKYLYPHYQFYSWLDFGMIS